MLQEIIETYPDYEFMVCDGFDDCILGYDYGTGEHIRLIYSVKKVLDKLAKDMSDMDAIEYFEFNMRGAYVGETTPIWCQDDL